jgi:hypothetical protein
MIRGLKEYSSMSTEGNLRPPQAGHPEGYEHSDADVRSLLRYGFTLFVVLVLVLISMRWVFFYFAHVQQLGPPASPFENARVLPPQPRLQVQPGVDLHTYCEGQLQQLDTYGWVDPNNEVVRIPVDRAMDLILERGLPARPAVGAASRGASGSTEYAGMMSAPQANGLEGPCRYLVKPSGQNEGK